MNIFNKRTLIAFSLLAASQAAHATIVLVETNVGNFEINLFDQTAPVTVQNFLKYVNEGAYNNTVIHRAVKNFVVQGGGYKFNGNTAQPLVAIPQKDPIQNEPKWSNVRATISMAKEPNKPNSARSQWFINLVNNADPALPNNLDRQNGGFSVFGVVTGNGMEIVDTVDDYYTPTTGAYASIPLRNYTAADATNNVAVTEANMIKVERITVINPALDTAKNLTPAANTQAGTPEPSGPSSSGGALSLWFAISAGLLAFRRRLSLR